jgi:flavin reductase (DIM6/NTAB) family NADH-FMN oxidoreductase RutF
MQNFSHANRPAMRDGLDAKVKNQLSDELRIVMRGIGATVTVISTTDTQTQHCMIATAVMPMSLEPPTVLIAVNASASCHKPILVHGAFCVNVLGSEHLALGSAIARAASRDRFNEGSWSRVGDSSTGSTHRTDVARLPYLKAVQAALACRVVRTVQHGTHTLFFGEVVWIERSSQIEPLLYCDGEFGRFEVHRPRELS